jgi:hypothetical protein
MLAVTDPKADIAVICARFPVAVLQSRSKWRAKRCHCKFKRIAVARRAPHVPREIAAG